MGRWTLNDTTRSMLACCVYGFFSIAITFFNKAVLSSYKFTWPNVMTLAQVCCSLLLLLTLRVTRIVQFPTPDWSTHKKVAPLSLAFCGMVLTGLAALNTLRRLTTLFTMFGESLWLGSRSSAPVQASVWAMILGAVVAGLGDFDYSPRGYALVLANCGFTAAYLLYIAKLGKSTNTNTFGLMYVNNLQSLPFILLICFCNGDFAPSELPSYAYLYEWDFIACFLFQSGLAFLLNYSIFLCTNVNSALATSVTGQIKNIATTAVGYFTFGDVTYSPWNIAGLIMGVGASIGYSGIKYQESETKRKAKDKELKDATGDEEDQSASLIAMSEKSDSDTFVTSNRSVSSSQDVAASHSSPISSSSSFTSSSFAPSHLPVALGPSMYAAYASSSSSASSPSSSSGTGTAANMRASKLIVGESPPSSV